MIPLTLLLLATPQPALVDVSGVDVIRAVKRAEEPLVLVNVWATWCGPCVEEMPMLIDVAKALEGKVRLVLVSTDFSTQRDEAEALLRRLDAPLPGYFKRQKDQPFIEALHPDWNGTIPATFIFDNDGVRLRFMQGKLTKLQLMAELKALLRERRAER